ncbi:MAG: ribosome maturation factor RimP [Deltaproteobacteria bacterium]|nr:ribosome maturation factor RimP [Deltaproteobacteria bacterium]
MQEAGRRVEALARPIVAAFGCDVVVVRLSQGKRRSVVTVFLDTVLPEPTDEDWKRAALPLVPGAEPPPAAYEGSRVSVETCGRASREIEAAIDADGAIVGSYVLEVSSPGLERPLVRPADFVRHRGRPIEVWTKEPLDGSRHLRGLLAQADPRGFLLVPPAAGSGPGGEPRRIDYENVVSARLVVEIRRPEKPGHPANKARKR